MDAGTFEKSAVDNMLTVFYSCLYRASLFPRLSYEIDATGKAVHYSPFDPQGRTFDGVSISDSGVMVCGEGSKSCPN